MPALGGAWEAPVTSQCILWKVKVPRQRRRQKHTDTLSYTHACTHTQTHTDTHTEVNTHTHTHTHTQTHTQTHTLITTSYHGDWRNRKKGCCCRLIVKWKSVMYVCACVCVEHACVPGGVWVSVSAQAIHDLPSSNLESNHKAVASFTWQMTKMTNIFLSIFNF